MLGNVVLDVTPVEVRGGSGRAPLRILALDGDDNTLTLTFFNNPAWAKKQLPLNQKRTVIGKLDAWGNEWQIVHPEVLEPGTGGDVPLREPVYGLTEGISNKRMRELALTGWNGRSQLPEWIEPSQLARDHWPAWRSALAEAHSDPNATNARKRLAYDEIFANQLALLLLRQVARRKRGCRCRGRAAVGQAAAALPADRCQQRVIGEFAATWPRTSRCCACSRAMSGRARPWWRCWRCWRRSRPALRRRCSPRPRSSPASTMRRCSANARRSECASRS